LEDFLYVNLHIFLSLLVPKSLMLQFVVGMPPIRHIMTGLLIVLSHYSNDVRQWTELITTL
jgi:hypothetical protein